MDVILKIIHRDKNIFRAAISYSFRVMGVGKDDNVTLERKSFIDFELGDSAKEDAEDTSLTEKKQIIDAIGSKDTNHIII